VCLEFQASVYYLSVSGWLKQYSDTLFGIWIPSVHSSFQYLNALLSIWIGFQASECFLYVSGYPSPQQPECSSSTSKCLLNAFEYPFKHLNAFVQHLDTPQQNFKINSRKFKNYLFSIKIVYYLSLLKIIVV